MQLAPAISTRNGTRYDIGLVRIFKYLAATPRPVKLLKYLIGKNWEAGVLPLNYSRPRQHDFNSRVESCKVGIRGRLSNSERVLIEAAD